MKQEVFEGYIDEQKFDDPVKFKEYLEQHKDAKNVSYSHSIREVADEQPKSAAVLEQRNNKADNKQAKKEAEVDLYPPYIDIDKVLSDPNYSVEDVETLYNKYLKDHKQAIKDLDADQLEAHYENLKKLRNDTKDTLKQNSKAMSKLDDEIEKYNHIIEDATSQIQSRKEQLQTLNAADSILGAGYRTIKEAIVDVNKHRERNEEYTGNVFQDFLNQLFITF